MADLAPVPIAQLLEQAANALSSQNADRAIDAAKEVLDAEPDNSRANLLMGQAAFQKSQPGAAVFLINALKGGETVTVPIRIYSKTRALQIPDGELALDQSEMRLTSALRPELNFKIARTEVKELSKRADEPTVTYITFKGKARQMETRPIGPLESIRRAPLFHQARSHALRA
ncbi:MAG TPA: tetratricopeptide repeat protein [Pyrinomonadaceae bacterium]|nr:tetratricopeptide repeat protein [Pyrinomonadaceae bacterium]